MPELSLETVSTIPLCPLDHWTFEQVRAPQRRDPWWATGLVLVGAFFSIGAGSFLITVHLSL